MKRENYLGVVHSVVFTQSYLGVVTRRLLSEGDYSFAASVSHLQRFPLPYNRGFPIRIGAAVVTCIGLGEEN
jgi:hypothetical protein